MPNTKEKLIEKIDPILKSLPWGEITPNTAERIADCLIEEGVTFAKDNDVPSKWISVKERLPDIDGKYLVFEQSNGRSNTSILRFAKDARKVDRYDFKGRWKNAWYEYDSEWGHYTVDSVTHWMPLPEPPKGE